MTAVPPSGDSAYKLAALQALATGGTQAKAALDSAKAAQATSQANALKQAAANSAAYGLGQAGDTALQEPINTAYNTQSGISDRVGAGTLPRFNNLQEPTGRLFDAKLLAGLNRGRGGGGSSGGSGGDEPESVEETLPPSPVDRTFFRDNPVTKKVDAQMQKNLGFALQTGTTPSAVRTRLLKEFAGNDKAVVYYYQVYNRAYEAQKAAAAAAKKKKK